VFINNSLLDFYSKCDCIGEMEKLFDGMPECDNVSYNVMLAGYAWRRCAAVVQGDADARFRQAGLALCYFVGMQFFHNLTWVSVLSKGC
jgi:pentatricopeptide repeat protein